MGANVIERENPWSAGRPEKVEFREIDLSAYGAEIAPQAGHTIYARKLGFAEGLRLGQWVSRTLGPTLGAALAAVFEVGATGAGDRSEAIRAEIAAALPLAVDALASGDDWYDLLVARCKSVACYSPAGTRDPTRPGGLFPLDEDALETLFAPAPAEGLLLLVALIVEGIGPLPGLGRGRLASHPS